MDKQALVVKLTYILNKNGGRNKSILGLNAVFTPDVIDDIHIKG